MATSAFACLADDQDVRPGDRWRANWKHDSRDLAILVVLIVALRLLAPHLGQLLPDAWTRSDTIVVAEQAPGEPMSRDR